MTRSINHLSIICIISGLLLLNGSLRAQVSEAEKLFEQGVYQLEAVGDFEEAIIYFNKVVAEYPTDKQVAAKALLKKGFCYERLGSQKATEAYEQIINQYPDQVSLVSQAKERLIELRKSISKNLTMARILENADYLECQTLSPDGTKLAGIGWNPGQNLVVYDLVTGTRKYVTDYDVSKSSCTTYLPVWSSDSKEIVHIVNCWGEKERENEQLGVTTIDGRSRILFESAEGGGIIPCDWLPDNSAVLAISGNPDGFYKMVLISVTDGSLHELFSLKRSNQMSVPFISVTTSPATVSPDGKFIAFVDVSGNGKQDIYIIPVNGGSEHILTDHPASDIEPRWSPDGKYVVFRSDRNGSWALWGVAVRDGQPDGLPFMILEGMQDQELAGWTQKGLCTRTLTGVSDIYILDIDPMTNDVLGIPRLLEMKAYGVSTFPLWSSDGNYLSFKTYNVSEDAHYLMIMSSKGGDAKRYQSPYHDISPVGGAFEWLPGGSAIGTIYWDKDMNLYFSKLDPQSGEWDIRQVPTGDFNGHLRQLTWSENGRSFYYAKISEDNEIIGIINHNLETGKENYLFQYPRDDSIGWNWWKLNASRDNRHLAFNLQRKLGVLDTRTGNLQQIECDPDKNFYAPAWSPDGKYLLVKGPHGKGNDMNELYVVCIADGSYKSLDISQYLSKGACILSSHDWSPDGKTIVFDVRTWKSEANLIQNVITEK
jgi:Tol biopolymer transport system component